MDFLQVVPVIGVLVTLLVGARVMLREKGIDSAKLAEQITRVEAAATEAARESTRMRQSADRVIEINILLSQLQDSVKNIRAEMHRFAETDRVHGILDNLDRRLRKLEQQLEPRKKRRTDDDEDEE